MSHTTVAPVASEPVRTRFSSQAEAVREARIAIWGDVAYAHREYVHTKTRPDVAVPVPVHSGLSLSVTAVSANVNGKLVVIYFDAYGRKERVEVIK